VAIILIIFLKLNGQNWQISCILNVCLCLEDWGLGLLPPLGYATGVSTGDLNLYCLERQYNNSSDTRSATTCITDIYSIVVINFFNEQ